MEVEEGTSFELVDGTWQRPAITLSDADLERSLLEWGFTSAHIDAMTLELRYRWASLIARQFLLARTVQAKMADERWQTTERPLLESQLRDEIVEVHGKIKAGAS